MKTLKSFQKTNFRKCVQYMYKRKSRMFENARKCLAFKKNENAGKQLFGHGSHTLILQPSKYRKPNHPRFYPSSMIEF